MTENNSTDVLALFADCVNAYRGGNPEEIAAVNAIWDAKVPPVRGDEPVEGPMDCEIPDLSDYDYDRVADNYERNWV